MMLQDVIKLTSTPSSARFCCFRAGTHSLSPGSLGGGFFSRSAAAKNPLPGVAGERAEEIPARRALAPDQVAAQNGKSRKNSLPLKSTRMSISSRKYFFSNKNS
jgi:hypothetical protein